MSQVQKDKEIQIMAPEDVLNKYGDAELIGYPAIRAMADWAQLFADWIRVYGFNSAKTTEELYQIFVKQSKNG